VTSSGLVADSFLTCLCVRFASTRAHACMCCTEVFVFARAGMTGLLGICSGFDDGAECLGAGNTLQFWEFQMK
jgi:hypothetical protein